MPEYNLPLITKISDISNLFVKNELETIIKNDFVLGIMLWGSRATQFGEIDTDYDALIYVDQNYFNRLDKNEIAILKYNEQVSPKKMLIDFTYWADSIFEDQLKSPLDIDHAAYVEGIVLADKTGKLEEWRKKLANYDTETHKERLLAKWISFTISFGYAQKNHDRNNIIDMKINLYRALTIAVSLGFNLLKTWEPPLKWWSKYAKKYGMDKELYVVYSKTIQDSTMNNLKELIALLKKRLENEGVDLSNFKDDFFETIYPSGRNKLIKYSYF